MLISKKDRGDSVEEVAKGFEGLGFRIVATRCAHAFLEGKNIRAEIIYKLEGRLNIADTIKNHQEDAIKPPKCRCKNVDCVLYSRH